jgi:hypothetical protein
LLTVLSQVYVQKLEKPEMWRKAVSYNKLKQTHNVYGVHKWTLYISFGNKSNVWYRHIYSHRHRYSSSICLTRREIIVRGQSYFSRLPKY